MAAAKTSKKRSTSSKKNNKKVSAPTVNRLKDLKVVLFILLFGAIGTILLFRTLVNPRVVIGANDIAVGYYDSKPTVISRDPITDIKTYESYTASYLVLEGGTILCDDGNSEGTVFTGELGKGRVKQLRGEIEALGLSSVASVTSSSSDPNGVLVSTLEGYVLATPDAVSTYSVYPGSQKPDKLARMQEKILKECAKATTRQERGKTKEFKIPQARTASSSSDALNKLAERLSPKASAVTPAPPSGGGTTPAPAATVTIQSGFSNSIFNQMNSARNGAGVPSFIRSLCLNDVAHLHAKRLAQQADQNNLYHNPNLQNEFVYICNGKENSAGWQRIGENVGVVAGNNPVPLFNGYMNSPTHRANIMTNGRFNRVGVGTYSNSVSGKYWNVIVFGLW